MGTVMPRRVSFEPAQGQQQEQGNNADSDDGDYFSHSGSEDGTISPTTNQRRRASMSIRIPPNQIKTDMAFTALQYLPMPVLVLSSAKTIVLANEAMGRLFGIDWEQAGEEEGVDGDKAQEQVRSATDILSGNRLSDLGMDLLQGGNAVFVAWDDFLETVVDDASRAQASCTQLNTFHPRDGLETPPTGGHRRSTSSSSLGPKGFVTSRTEVHDAVVDVVFSTMRDPRTGLPLTSRTNDSGHIHSQMIVSVWATEDEQYFTLTFTAATSSGSSTAGDSASSRTTSRAVTRTSTSLSTLSSGKSSSSSSGISGDKRHKSHIVPSFASPVNTEFPPRGPPAKFSSVQQPTIFSKSNRLKDAILNSMNIPAYALWKDESFGLPNKAAMRMIYPWIEDGVYDSNEQAKDFLSRYVLYNEDFSQKIPLEDFPIMRLMRERTSFENYRVGMYSAKDGSRMLYDVNGEIVRDDKGEFLGGLVLFNDVTEFAATITRQKEENAQQFEEISNMVPQMIWRTTPEGAHDYFSDRWYAYTGLTPENSLGDGWVNAFHPDDLEIAKPKWAHCLATGDEYLTEYRARNANGEWRWMLGRAIPMRDHTGKIVKWFGTCTDIHDLVLVREDAKQTREHLERVVDHAGISLWATDKARNLTLFEGRIMISKMEGDFNKDAVLGKNLVDIFKSQDRSGELDTYLGPIDAILAGKIQEDVVEDTNVTTGRVFRTRLFPLLRQERKGGIEGDSFIDGVVATSMDVTELRRAADELRTRDLENAELHAQSVAAKEASKMKSQFLANMSHEIRTPIAGVIGMSELLLDDDASLSKDQKECAENIQRSANGLLTVINDILDFSKVESGRLDIEEVQFDLSVVIQDVNKMLRFAAERKGLKYVNDIAELKSWKVMGDPGRVRQVLTNLLTNSIKFTSEGSVTMRVAAIKETNDMVEIQFTVEDTGIGIEEEVRRRLFKPFSQADSSTARRFGGTGLGLTISKNLVELMRGSISLQSRLGAGTKASFRIPFSRAPYQTTESPLVDISGSIPDRLQSDLSLSRAGSETSGPTTPTTPAKGFHPQGNSIPTIPNSIVSGSSVDSIAQELDQSERKKMNILVVEDNPINQQIALRTIRKLGFPVTAVWNGKEALDYLQDKSNPRPDVVLMDVQMPVMDGYQATSTIRNDEAFDNPEIQSMPIVAMTASAIQGDREKCENAGMNDYLAKPVKKQHLEKMLVKWALEGRRKRAELRANQKARAQQQKRPVIPRNASSYISERSRESAEVISPEVELVQRAAFERSSESAGEMAIRQQQAEEKAIALRDDVLIESGEDPKTKLGHRFAEEAQTGQVVAAAAALTTENMQRHTQSDRLSHLRRPVSRDDSDVNSLVATLGDQASVSNTNPRNSTVG